VTKRGLRIVILTNGNYFANTIIAPMLYKFKDEICAVISITGDYQGRDGFMAAFGLLRKMAFPYFVYKVFVIAVTKLMVRLGGGNHVGRLENRFKGTGTRYVSYQTVNNEQILSLLTEIEPDLLISVSCPQKIGEAMVALAKRGAINVHSSLLPRYAGLAPYFWVLSRGEKETGTSVHYITDKFDGGNVLAQRRMPVQPGISAFELFERLARAGGEALIEAIEAAARGDAGEKQRAVDRSYYSHPTLRSYFELRRRGYRLIRFSDLRRLMKSTARDDAGEARHSFPSWP
jgi:folate-dependent phosphoribosylglycinamide formyltransferase PurN